MSDARQAQAALTPPSGGSRVAGLAGRRELANMLLRSIVLAAAVVFGTVKVAAIAGETPASKPAKKTPVDFRKLKEFMPDQLGGVKRSSNKGEKIAAGEMVITQAQAEYAKAEPAENDPSVNVEIFDYSGAGDMAAVATAWQQLQIDKESDDGYERTTKIKEQPAFETYQNAAKSGQVQLWVGGRFYVNVQTRNLPADQVKKVVESLPIEKMLEAAKEKS